jgi:tRNA dimethylallyltransferase
MNKLLVICGPTATGKTSLGIHLAKKISAKGGPASGWQGEIVSADSRQVYKGMDIGTGKDLPADSKLKTQNSKLQLKGQKYQVGYYLFEGIPVWMLDVVTPAQEFSVAQYVELARKIIEDTWQRKKLPIIVGGTGFYIRGLIDGIETLGVVPNWELRKRLEKFSVQKLFEILARLDSSKAASMNASDRRNPRRLIRAIEIATRNRKQKTENRKQKIKAKILIIGLKLEPKALYQRIDKRVDKQVKMGAEEEVEKLLKKGYSWDLPAMSAMGYGVWKPYFEGKQTLREVIERWKFDEHGYARRQMTWFKRDKRVHWFDITEPGWQDKVEQLAESWYNPSDA